MYYLNYKRWKR